MMRWPSRHRTAIRGAITAAVAALTIGLRLPAAALPTQHETTYNRDVAPILFKHCSSCHHPGGSAPFSLVTYQAARQRATLIGMAASLRQMPPWRAETDAGPFVGLEQLSDAEIRTLQTWASSGGSEGDAEDLPPTPVYRSGWQLGTPDLVVTLDRPYMLPAAGTDDYRTFVIPLPVEGVRYVRGLEFRPGAGGAVIHHANILLDRTRRSRQLDEADPLPGYSGALARSAGNPDGHFLGYAPGQQDPLLPKGMAWRLEAGTDLVVQLHLNPSGREVPVQPSIGFYFTDDPPHNTPLLLRMGRRTLQIAPGESRYRVLDTYTLPVAASVASLKPHAHFLARSITVAAALPGGRTLTLLNVPAWNFKWQNAYRFATPVDLPKGTQLTAEFVFDNSAENAANPSRPPRAVLWGPASTDEMADVWIQVQVPHSEDRQLLASDFGRKATEEEAAGYKSLLLRNPDDPVLNDDLAMISLELNRPADAVAGFTRSLRAKPDRADAHFNLAAALAAQGNPRAAVDELTIALRLDPARAAAHTNLANLLSDLGERKSAAEHYAAALRLEPSNAKAHNGLATLLMAHGELDEAARHLATAVQTDPRLVVAHLNLAVIDYARARYAQAAQHYREALEQVPTSLPVLAAYAWLLATSPEEGMRDGERATALAERAVRLSQSSDPLAFEALAAGLAERGRFADAFDASSTAIRLAGQDEARRTRLHQQLSLYERGEPVRSVHPLQ